MQDDPGENRTGSTTAEQRYSERETGKTSGGNGSQGTRNEFHLYDWEGRTVKWNRAGLIEEDRAKESDTESKGKGGIEIRGKEKNLEKISRKKLCVVHIHSHCLGLNRKGNCRRDYPDCLALSLRRSRYATDIAAASRTFTHAAFAPTRMPRKQDMLIGKH